MKLLSQQVSYRCFWQVRLGTTVHDWSGALLGFCIGAGGFVVVLWTCLQKGAVEPPVNLPELTPARSAASERWSLARALTGVLSLLVEGLRLLARSHIPEERFKVEWHAGIQAGGFPKGQLDHFDLVQKLCFARRRLQNLLWALVDG